MSKNRNRRKKAKKDNTTLVMEVLGSNYVSPYVEAKPKKSESPPKRKEKQVTSSTPNSKSIAENTPEVQAASYKKVGKVSVVPDILPKGNLKDLKQIKNLINCSCEELTINFKKKKIIVKDAGNMNYVFDFDGNEVVKYSYSGSSIEAVK